MYTRIRSTPLYIFIPLFLAVYIPCSIVVLVPIDLISSSKGPDAFFYLSEHARYILWRVTYWGAFFLTWLVLPGLQGYVDSGYHGTTRKVIDSFHRNARYQLAILVVGGAGLLYVILSSGLTFGSIKALAIALSHSYALVIALWLMGHALINLPRNYWVEADPSVKLRHYYQQATQANDMIAEAQSDYADIAAEVFALGSYRDIHKYESWIESLIERVETGPGIPLAHSGSGPVTGHARVQVERSMINDEYLSSLTGRFKTARNRLIRYDADWQKLLREASRAEDIINSKELQSLVFRFKRTALPPRAAYWYYSVISPQVRRFFAVVFASLTFIIVSSEITHGTVLSLVNIVIEKTSGFWQQTFSSVFLGYMCFCAIASLTKIRIFKVYALVYRHTDLSSLLFYAMYACRLTVPLSFNFITLITSRDSVFQEFLGKFINLTPLGKYFNDWLPRFILVPMLMTTFHVYDRVRDFFGFGLSFDSDQEDFDEEGRPLKGSVVEGRQLVRRALTDNSYRYAIRHPNIAASSTPGRSAYSRDNNSTSQLLGGNSGSNGDSRSSSDRNDDRSRTSRSHLPVGTPHRQLGGRKFNRSRLDDQQASIPYSDSVNTSRQESPDSLERRGQNSSGPLSFGDSKIAGFFSGIGDKLKGFGKKNADSNDLSDGSARRGLLPRWQQQPTDTSSRYQDESEVEVEDDEDDDDEDDVPIVL